MPTMRLLRPCSKPGCPELVPRGERYCEKHRGEAYAYDRNRGTRTQRGYTNRWLRYSAHYLKQHPLCMCDDCKQRMVPLPSEHVDHIIPVSGPNDPLFWEPSNHQALNHACHNRKTARERVSNKGINGIYGK